MIDSDGRQYYRLSGSDDVFILGKIPEGKPKGIFLQDMNKTRKVKQAVAYKKDAEDPYKASDVIFREVTYLVGYILIKSKWHQYEALKAGGNYYPYKIEEPIIRDMKEFIQIPAPAEISIPDLTKAMEERKNTHEFQ